MIKINFIDGARKPLPAATAGEIFDVCFVAFTFTLVMTIIVSAITYVLDKNINH